LLEQTNDALNSATQNQKKMNDELEQGKKKAEGLWSKLKGMVKAKSVFKGIQDGFRAYDTFMSMQVRLGLIVDEGQTPEQLSDKIFAAARRARSDYASMATSASKLGVLAGDAFSGSDEIVAFTELMQKAFKLGGASTSEQQAGMDNIIQAMAAGKLQGADFQSIMANAPMLVNALATFTGRSIDELSVMAAEGAITADIIKTVLFAAAEEINNKFEALPTTFGEVWQQFKDAAFKSFVPVFQRLSDWLNSPQGSSFVQSLTSAIHAAAQIVELLLQASMNVFWFISENWSLIAPTVWGIVSAIMAYKMAQLGLNFAMLASPITWIILGVVALVAVIDLAIAGVSRFAGTSVNAIGIIAGVFAFLGATIWNIIVGVINAVNQLVWSVFLEPLIGIQEWVQNLIYGGFDSFGDALKNLLGQILSWLLSFAKIATMIIDAIFGTKWTDKLGEWQDDLLEWGKNENAITLSRDIPTLDSHIDYEDAWNAGVDWGSNLFSGFGDMSKGMDDMYSGLDNMAKDLDDLYSGFENESGIDQINKIGQVGEVGKIRDTVDISSEDLKIMRELAEMRHIQNFVTLTPTVQVTTGPVSKEVDVDTMIARIETFLTEQIASSAQGVYG
jgi:tape measure domain